MTSKEKALKIVEFILDKQAKDIVVLDVGDQSGFCDYFVICSAESTRQVDAIQHDTVRACRKNNIEVRSHHSDESLRWVLVDIYDIVLHIFFDEARKFYDLESLWKEAKKVRIPARLKKIAKEKNII